MLSKQRFDKKLVLILDEDLNSSLQKNHKELLTPRAEWRAGLWAAAENRPIRPPVMKMYAAGCGYRGSDKPPSRRMLLQTSDNIHKHKHPSVRNGSFVLNWWRVMCILKQRAGVRVPAAAVCLCWPLGCWWPASSARLEIQLNELLIRLQGASENGILGHIGHSGGRKKQIALCCFSKKNCDPSRYRHVGVCSSCLINVKCKWTLLHHLTQASLQFGEFQDLFISAVTSIHTGADPYWCCRILGRPGGKEEGHI